MLALAAIVSSAALLGALAYLAARYVSLGASRTVDDLESAIEQIQDLSDARLSLMIREVWGDRFLQFRSVDRGRPGRSLELWLPTTGWAECLHPWVARRCTESGLRRRAVIDTTGKGFDVVSFDGDSVAAAAFARDILLQVFKVPIDRKVKVRIDVHKLNRHKEED